MVCRHLWEQLKLAFPRKSKLPLAERRLSCHHHANDSSRSRHVSRSVCHCLDALTATPTIVICVLKKEHQLKASQTCELGMKSYYKLVLTMFTIGV